MHFLLSKDDLLNICLSTMKLKEGTVPVHWTCFLTDLAYVSDALGFVLFGSLASVWVIYCNRV